MDGWPSGKALVLNTSERVERTWVRILHHPQYLSWEIVIDTKAKGNLGELAVLLDLVKNGWKVAIPYGENDAFDLIAYKGNFENPLRVQVKHCISKQGVVEVPLRTISNGKVSKVYTAEMVDIVAVYEPEQGRCFYIPSVYFQRYKSSMKFAYKPNKRQIDIEQFLRISG